MSDGDVADLVNDYVGYRLWKNGIRLEYFNPTTPPTSRLKAAIRALGDEFESRYESFFLELCSQLDVIVASDVRATFLSVLEQLFSEGVHWARVVALFCLSGALSLQFARKNEPNLVSSIVQWTTVYINTHLIHWIHDHNGWDGMIDFYNGHPEKRMESPWPKLKNFFCGIAAGALGALTIGAILTSKT